MEGFFNKYGSDAFSRLKSIVTRVVTNTDTNEQWLAKNLRPPDPVDFFQDKCLWVRDILANKACLSDPFYDLEVDIFQVPEFINANYPEYVSPYLVAWAMTKKSRRGRRSRGSRGGLLKVATSDRDVNRQIAQQLAVGPGNPIATVLDPQPMHIARRKVHTISRSVGRGTVTVTPTLPVFGALSFALSDLPNPADFTALFDQYRFQQVRVKFIPASAQGNQTFHLPPLLTVIDYDDANVPTSLDQLRQYSTLNLSPTGTVTHIRTIMPRLAVNVFGAGVFGNFSQARLWCDSASPGISWYGLKYGLDFDGTLTDTVFYIECEYVISFRSTI